MYAFRFVNFIVYLFLIALPIVFGLGVSTLVLERLEDMGLFRLQLLLLQPRGKNSELIFVVPFISFVVGIVLSFLLGMAYGKRKERLWEILKNLSED